LQPVGCDVHPLPTRHCVSSGQSEISAHDPRPLHVTSHEHDIGHAILRLHEPAPVHVTLQGYVLHWI
jgi:hypothetical protein